MNVYSFVYFYYVVTAYWLNVWALVIDWLPLFTLFVVLTVYVRGYCYF